MPRIIPHGPNPPYIAGYQLHNRGDLIIYSSRVRSHNLPAVTWTPVQSGWEHCFTSYVVREDDVVISATMWYKFFEQAEMFDSTFVSDPPLTPSNSHNPPNLFNYIVYKSVRSLYVTTQPVFTYSGFYTPEPPPNPNRYDAALILGIKAANYIAAQAYFPDDGGNAEFDVWHIGEYGNGEIATSSFAATYPHLSSPTDDHYILASPFNQTHTRQDPLVDFPAPRVGYQVNLTGISNPYYWVGAGFYMRGMNIGGWNVGMIKR